MSKKRQSQKRTQTQTPPWYDVRAESDDTTEVYIYDRIGAGWFEEGVGAKEFSSDMAKITTPNVSLRINSPGGSVFDGVAIFNTIDRHPAHVTTHIDGVAASIASVIALAGDEVIMSEGSLFMVHNPWGAAMGEAKDMRKTADTLDKVRGTLLATYRDRSWLTEAEVSDAMDAETWYTADEAQAAGFVDTVDGDAPALAASFDLSEFSNYPKTAGRPPSGETEGETIVGSTTTEAPTVDLSNLATRDDMTNLESRLQASLQVSEPAPPPASPLAQFTALVLAYGTDKQKRTLADVAPQAALADMVTGTNTGLTDPGRTSKEVLDLFDATRYFVSRVSDFGFPESGITHTLPQKTQRTTVGAGSGEKVEAPSRTVLTSNETWTGVWYKGALDISYELIRTSSPGAVELAVSDMIEEAALHSEQVFVAAAEAAATHTGAAIDFTTYAAFIGSVRGAVRTIRAATRNVTPKFALTSDSWDLLLTFVDTTDRRQFATIGSTNADGSAGLDSVTMSVGGLEFFESPESAVDLAYNDVSLKKAELAPMTLASDNVALIGRDVGILGNIMCIDRVPAGILSFEVV